MAYENDYKNFLLKLDETLNKTTYARVTALTFSEYPIESIEGKITQGSINIDGDSAVRRTCSLSMVAQDFDYKDYLWGLNTKFKLEVGVANTIDDRYPDIIWFPQGIYLLTSFNMSRSVNNFSISLSGKDKMCLLNGEIGGTLDASIDFGSIEEEDKNGVWTIRKLPIIEIIRHAVHTYGGEPYHNIIINDLNDYGLELLEYRYDVPMYLYRKRNSPLYVNLLLESDSINLWDKDLNPTELSKLSVADKTLELLTDAFVQDNDTSLSPIYSKNSTSSQIWHFTKIEYGQTAGYRQTDLTYPGDLIANAGESVTSVLDKLKSMLSEFEYFYDLDGRFVFQKKQSFISTMWSPTTDGDNTSQINSSYAGESATTSYTFTNNELVTAFNNNPNLLNVKNDYSIWGERESVSGAKLPIHMRYAIDQKPTKYTQITVEQSEVNNYNLKYNTTLKGRSSSEAITFISADEYNDDDPLQIYCDWREVLYQMASDYFKYNHLDDFELKVIDANSPHKLYVTGRTGYEQYYTDIQGFWRQLYYPEINQKKAKAQAEYNTLKSEVEAIDIYLNGYVDDRGIKKSGLTGKVSALSAAIDDLVEGNGEEDEGSITTKAQHVIDYCTKNLPADLPFVPNITATKDNYSQVLSQAQTSYSYATQELRILSLDRDNALAEVEKLTKDVENYYDANGPYPHWNKNVYEVPDALNFWIDFLDTEGALSQFNVKTIGPRAKVVNDTSVKAIYFRETPSVIFQECGTSYGSMSNYKFIQVPKVEEMFSISSQGKNAKERLDELLYQHGYCNESATITTLPIYYLQPNTRVYVSDKDTNLSGDYIVSKISFSLAQGGTMSLTATKAAENIL